MESRLSRVVGGVVLVLLCWGVGTLFLIQKEAQAQDAFDQQLLKRLNQMATKAPQLAVLAREDGAFEYHLNDLRAQGLELVVAEKLLYPPKGSVQIGEYTLLHGANGALLEWLSTRDVEQLSSMVLKGDDFWVVTRFAMYQSPGLTACTCSAG